MGTGIADYVIVEYVMRNGSFKTCRQSVDKYGSLCSSK